VDSFSAVKTAAAQGHAAVLAAIFSISAAHDAKHGLQQRSSYTADLVYAARLAHMQGQEDCLALLRPELQRVSPVSGKGGALDAFVFYGLVPGCFLLLVFGVRAVLAKKRKQAEKEKTS
jgi:hypothetical protein